MKWDQAHLWNHNQIKPLIDKEFGPDQLPVVILMAVVFR